MTTDRRLLLSRQHEAEVHELLGGHASKSSGNQWHDQADGYHDPHDEFALAWDCKCVLPTTKSMSFSRDDLAKIRDQAHGRIPVMPMRFYDSERGLVGYDMILVPLQHYAELRERALEAIDG